MLTPDTARAVTTALAERLGVPPTVAGFSSVPAADLVAAQAELTASIAAAPDPARWREITTHQMPFEPTVDGTTVPMVPIEGVAAGAGRDVDVLIGSNTDEHALFTVPSGLAGFVDDNLLAMLVGALGADPAAVVTTYRADAPQATPGEVLTSALGDWFFRIPAIRVAEARLALGVPTHVYEFTWRSPQFGGRLGACHSLEIGFVFDTVDDPAGVPLMGDDPPRGLAEEMHGAWVAFVRGDDPGWPAYGVDRTVRMFGTPSRTLADPSAQRREVWDGVR